MDPFPYFTVAYSPVINNAIDENAVIYALPIKGCHKSNHGNIISVFRFFQGRLIHRPKATALAHIRVNIIG
jgi:hypothetical protein